MNNFIRNLALKNWGLKLFSFFLAMVLWLALIPEEKIFSEKTLTVPLELHNVPADMEVVEKPTSTVDVKIRAPNRRIDQITSANVHAVLDLQRAHIDQRDYPLDKNMMSLPEGAEVKEINPSQVVLKLEMTKEILLDVEVNIAGQPAEGFKVVSTKVFPSQVLIKGPESKITEKQKVRTSPIDISSLTQSAEIEADLILPSPDLRLVSAQSKVLVSILIEEDKPEEQEAEVGNKKQN
ncbi:YbbR-like domain-containing protein [Acidobacteriota bacterium]